MVISCTLQAAEDADITIRPPIRLAAHQIEFLPHVTESQINDTLRVLIQSMDFGDGWEVLRILCRDTGVFRREKILLSIIRLLSFELKTNIVEECFADMLDWLFFLKLGPERVEASDLLLNLGGHGTINATHSALNGYTILHHVLLFHHWEDNVSAVVARGPDLHRRGFDTNYTPFEESPTSLAMYSAKKFSSWLRALASVDVDLENFIDQELELNLEGHAGWERETLLELFTHGDRPDLHHPLFMFCSDCVRTVSRIEVQPYWRHLIERIKGRMHPCDPVSAVSEVDEDDLGSLGEAVSSSTYLTAELDTTRNDTLLNPDRIRTDKESESETDSSENSALTQGESVCLYGKHQKVCIDCWLYYKRTGTRKQLDSDDEDSSETGDSSSSDDSSECEYSPYLIHS